VPNVANFVLMYGVLATVERIVGNEIKMGQKNARRIKCHGRRKGYAKNDPEISIFDLGRTDNFSLSKSI
jgi:hypothetical protein